MIVPDEIYKYVPVLKAPKGVQIVEWEKDQVEDSGLLKIDVLGNRSLAVVRDTIKQINLQLNVNQDPYIGYHKIQPIEDMKTREIMSAGKTMGVFYIESPSVRQLMAKAKVVDFEHIVIFSSIIRPAANRFINVMLERIHGKRWNVIHKDLEYLKETYGIMIYQEQVQQAAQILAGYSLVNRIGLSLPTDPAGSLQGSSYGLSIGTLHKARGKRNWQISFDYLQRLILL